MNGRGTAVNDCITKAVIVAENAFRKLIFRVCFINRTEAPMGIKTNRIIVIIVASRYIDIAKHEAQMNPIMTDGRINCLIFGFRLKRMIATDI
ncbi:MAG: hypothetical protein GXZ01_03460 [Clostridiaceae bacterium]|nr:hypothetical protein [Clostridiaceae bacterium]